MLDDAAFQLDDWLASEIAAEFARANEVLATARDDSAAHLENKE